uniref:Uncharacterized protein n=1 Tax=Ixodes ricinus TaxID=34613 RepID=A0A6B0V4C9_IXORI
MPVLLGRAVGRRGRAVVLVALGVISPRLPLLGRGLRGRDLAAPVLVFLRVSRAPVLGRPAGRCACCAGPAARTPAGGGGAFFAERVAVKARPGRELPIGLLVVPALVALREAVAALEGPRTDEGSELTRVAGLLAAAAEAPLVDAATASTATPVHRSAPRSSPTRSRTGHGALAHSEPKHRVTVHRACPNPLLLFSHRDKRQRRLRVLDGQLLELAQRLRHGRALIKHREHLFPPVSVV